MKSGASEMVGTCADGGTTVLVVGSTGATGRCVLDAGAKKGLNMVALARSPEKLANFSGRVVRGDVLEGRSLEAALRGTNAVICTLGTPLILRGQVTLLSEGTRNLIAAMRKTEVKRLLCVTGMGAGDSRGHGGFLYDRVALPLLLGRIYEDKDRQEALVKASGLQWTLVRPSILTNETKGGAFRVITDWTGHSRMTSISRQSLAEFLVGEAIDGDYIGREVNISN